MIRCDKRRKEFPGDLGIRAIHPTGGVTSLTATS